MYAQYYFVFLITIIITDVNKSCFYSVFIFTVRKNYLWLTYDKHNLVPTIYCYKIIMVLHRKQYHE